MWTIRQEQTEAFRQNHLQKFEDEMVEHLRKAQAEHWKVMGEPDGRRAIRFGIEQARKHGFTRRGPVRFYIDLMFNFGGYFDTDPQYRWASAVLVNPERLDETVIANRLFSAMSSYFAEVVDPEREHLRAGVLDLLNRQLEDVLQLDVDVEELMLRTLRSVCPLRCDYTGESVLRRMIQRSFELARGYDLATSKGKILMATLTFAVGHGFYRDPLDPWIVRRLEKRRWPDANKRVEDLSSKSLLYLKNVLASRG